MATDKKTIKSYGEYALRWAELKRSGKNIAHTFLEKPAMYSKLPDLKGKSVLCVGCGTGEECEYIQSLGTAKVVGIDISKGLIEVAKKSYAGIEFLVMDMEKMDFPTQSFDFVYSSLTIHYVRDWIKTLGNIQDVLKDDGTFIFSTHHPIKWGGETKRSDKKDSFLMGYTKYKDGKYEIFGDYLNTRKINDVWFNEFKVSYYHRPLSEIFRDILQSGFIVTDFIEPKPLKGSKEIFYNIHNKIPLFMIFELRKK